MRITIAVSECNMRSAGVAIFTIFLFTSILVIGTMSEQNTSNELQGKCCNTNSNIGGFLIDIENEVVGFRGENSSIPIYYSNNGEYALNITLYSENVSSNFQLFSSTGNTLISQDVESGSINQEYTLDLRINESATLGQETLSLKWKIEQDYLWTNITIDIKERSDLLWQFESGSNFIIEQNTSTTFGLELMNNATADENVSIALRSSTNWESTWNLGTDSNIVEQIEILSLEKTVVEFTINVPSVIEGLPLAEFPYSWSLSAGSNLDGAIVWYNFTIEVIPYHNLTIDTEESTFTIDPGSNIRIPVTYRNTGNIESQFHVSILPVDTEGNLMQIQENDRFAYNGWEVAIFGQESDIFLGANESVSIEIGVLSPYVAQGDITLQFEVYSYSNTQNIATLRKHVSVFETNGGSANISSMNCKDLLPGESCTGEISGTNTGNYHDDYELIVIDSPIWIEYKLSKTNVEIYPSQIEDFSTITITIANGTDALTSGTLRVAYTFVNNNSPLSILEINVSVGETIKWNVESSENLTNGNNFSSKYTLINQGNCPDSLVVSLTTSHYGKYGLIPPQGSEWEYDSNNIRSFVIRDFPEGEPLEIELWMHIPENQAEDGTAWFEVQVQSLEDEQFNWINRTEISFNGIKNSEKTTMIDFSQFGNDTKYFFNKYGYTAIGIFVSIVAIVWAISIRKRWNKSILVTKKKDSTEKTPIEWMAKFLPGIKTNNQDENNQFNNDSTQIVASSKEIEVATEIMDKHTKIQSDLEFEKLAEDLLMSEHEIHISNEKLKSKQDTSTMTKRIDPRGILTEKDKHNSHIVEDDDLDL